MRVSCHLFDTGCRHPLNRFLLWCPAIRRNLRISLSHFCVACRGPQRNSCFSGEWARHLILIVVAAGNSADCCEQRSDHTVRPAETGKGLLMTAATLTQEQALLSSSLGPSVLDAIVQANMDLKTMPAPTIEKMLRYEELRQRKSRRQTSYCPCSVCE